MVKLMIKKGLSTFLLFFILLALTSSGTISAQSLYFLVPTEVINVTMTSQGTMAIDYVITFDNTHGGSVIDYVDLGLPNKNYVLSSVSAEVNGNSITDIQDGDPEYIAIGITLGLGANSIQPGQTGTLHVFIGEVDKVLNVYTYNDISDYVSFQFTPNNFGSANLGSGTTNFTLSIHLPPEVQSGESIYYNPADGWPGDVTPSIAYDNQNQITFTWTSTNADAATSYMFGGAFPSKYVPASAIVKTSFFDKIGNFFTALGITAGGIFNFCFCAGIAALFFGLPVWGAINSRKRKLQYLPPKISIEGHGIKRGLTAVEVAILMEQPVDKILTMILFSVIKKGAATVITRDPLKIEVTKPLPEGLRPYETDFLAAMEEIVVERTKKSQALIVALVKSVSDSMKGFSRKETVAYYQEIMKKAWSEVEAAGTPEVKGQKFDENLDWTMLDKDFDNRTRNVFNTGPIFVPIWWGRYDPVYRSSNIGKAAMPSVGTGSGGGGSFSMPHLPGSDFAASLINGASSFSAGVVGNVSTFTSGVTKVTNPAPVSTSSGGGFKGGGGGGGHSCACACACAGCACACAGGGR
jgi:hypothetical protein